MKLCLAIAALGYAALTFAASSGIPPSWSQPAEPFEIFDGVYWVGTEGLAAYLFTTAEGHILLDVGLPQNAALVEASIEKLGLRVKDVHYLLNSHAHFDHAGGLARLQTDSGAEVIASEGDRYALEHGVYPGWEGRHELDFPPVHVDRVIGDGDTVSLGGVTLTAHLTPGHTAGCTSWSFTAHDRGGDHRALVFCSASVALNRLAPDPQYPGIVDDYRTTFRRMKALEVDAWLAPHPEQFGLAEKLARRRDGATNPFVNPEEKDRRMKAFEVDFERAVAAQGAGGEAADLERLEAEVAATERAFARSMAERDHQAFTSFLSDEAVFLSAKDSLRGKAAVAAAWQRFFDGPAAPFSWEPDRVEALASGLALSTGPVYDPAGTVTGRFTSIWRREAPGTWRIVFDWGSTAGAAGSSNGG